jgi:hypothetical protein
MLSVSIYACCMRQYFVAIVLKPRFKIDVVIMIICSIVIIINSVLTLQVSTAKPMIADLVE